MVAGTYVDESNHGDNEILVSSERPNLSPKQKRVYVKMLSKFIRCNNLVVFHSLYLVFIEKKKNVLFK